MTNVSTTLPSPPSTESTAPVTLADVMKTIDAPIALPYLLRAINEALETYVRERALTVQLVRITTSSEPGGSPTWTLAGNDDADGVLKITSPTEFCAHLKMPSTSSPAVVDEIQRQLWHKMTRTNASAFACALMLIVYASLARAGKRVVDGTTHYVTRVEIVEATVDEYPCQKAPLLRYVNNSSGDVTSPIALLHKTATVRAIVNPHNGELTNAITFKHRLIMFTLTPLDESDTTTRFLYVDFAGAALDVFSDDDTTHDDDDDDDAAAVDGNKTASADAAAASSPAPTKSRFRLPRVVFYDNTPHMSQHPDLRIYYALLHSQASGVRVLDAATTQSFVDATCRVDVGSDTRVPATGYLPTMTANSVMLLSRLAALRRERANSSGAR